MKLAPGPPPFYVPSERVNGVVLTKVWSLAGTGSFREAYANAGR